MTWVGAGGPGRKGRMCDNCSQIGIMQWPAKLHPTDSRERVLTKNDVKAQRTGPGAARLVQALTLPLLLARNGG